MEDQLQQAITFAREGHRAEARQIVTGLLRQSQADYRPWVVLSQLVDDPAQSVDCLRRAARLRPDLTRIQDMLAQAENKLPPSTPPAGSVFETALPHPLDDDGDTKPAPPLEDIPPYAEETRRSAVYRTQPMMPDPHTQPTLPSHGTTQLDRVDFQKALEKANDTEEDEPDRSFLSFLRPRKR